MPARYEVDGIRHPNGVRFAPCEVVRWALVFLPDEFRQAERMTVARILIIDDDEVMREVIRGFLVDAGHVLADAENGLVAQRILDQGSFDLVITDIFMPEKEGFEVIRDIRRSARPIPIIAISGSERPGVPDVLKYARELGASATLEKPFTQEQLVAAIRICLPAG